MQKQRVNYSAISPGAQTPSVTITSAEWNAQETAIVVMWSWMNQDPSMTFHLQRCAGAFENSNIATATPPNPDPVDPPGGEAVDNAVLPNVLRNLNRQIHNGIHQRIQQRQRADGKWKQLENNLIFSGAEAIPPVFLRSSRLLFAFCGCLYPTRSRFRLRR